MRPVVSFALLLALAVAGFSQEPALLEPQQGLVLLRNGQILQGKITRTGDRYLVWLADGEIRLAADQVELVCRNMEDGYRKKREKTELTRAEDRVRLAEWCLEHKLWDYADVELKMAATIEPSHPRLKLLTRRLELGRNPPKFQATEPAPAAVADQGPSAAELDRLVRDMPEGTVETFTQKIQPLLVNHCSAAACHGPRSETRLSFLRSSQQQVPNRRLTQRNLYSALQWIDADRLEASPLLTLSLSPHGGGKTPVFSNNEAWQFQQLAQWASNVTRGRARVEAGARPLQEAGLTPTNNPPALIPPGPPAAQPSRVRQASAEEGDLLPGEARNGEPSGVQTAGFEEPQAISTVPAPGDLRPRDPRQVIGPTLPARTPASGTRTSPVERPSRTPIAPAVPKVGQLPGAADPFGMSRPAPADRTFPTIHDLPQRSEPVRGQTDQAANEPADPFDPDVFNRRYFGRR